MTLEELKLIRATVLRHNSYTEMRKALEVLDREIKLKEMDPRKEER